MSDTDRSDRDYIPHRNVLGEDFLIVLGLFSLLTMYHMGKDSYLRWKNADDNGKAIGSEYNSFRAKMENNKPSFQVKILSALIAPAGDKNNVVIGAIARISNLGAPSAISGFWLEVKFPDGRDLSATIASPTGPQAKIFFGKSPYGDEVYLPGTSYWPNIMFDMVPQYGTRSGFIMGLVRGTSKEEIISKQATVIFTCIDPIGARASDGQIVTGKDVIQSGREIGLGDLQHHLPSTLRSGTLGSELLIHIRRHRARIPG